jgi:triosephosphate isomerase (TIM)
MIPKCVVGNWKMHKTTADARQLAQAVAKGAGVEDRVSVVVCPPFPYLSLVGDIFRGSRIALGAQNLYPDKEGAYTGEVSPTMLLDLGCKCVILGHSERRHTLGESDAFINRKVLAALAAGLDVIFCVGETLNERAARETEGVLERQIVLGLAHLPPPSLARLSVAYEPVWAIGSPGHHASPEQADQAHAVIRRCFGRLFGDEAARKLSVQYGGSVEPENAGAFLSRPGVDGCLIGGASLHAGPFLAIVGAAVHASQTMKQSA